MPELWERDRLVVSLHTTFSVTTKDGQTVELELFSVSGLLETERQRNFSVVFRGPLDMPLGQGMFRMEHNSLESLDLFIVPVGRTEKGFEYEAVFNHLK